MKFLILSKYCSYFIEAEDFEEAVREAWDQHSGYEYVMAIVKVEEILII